MPYEEAEVALRMAQLLDENRALREQLQQATERGDRLEAENQQLQQRLAELERTAARQAAPFRRREPLKIPADQRKRPGRKPGHHGACRPTPTHVDQEIDVPLTCCPQCHGSLQHRQPLTQYIEELPPIQPHVTRLTTWSAKCPACGPVRSTHPLQTSLGQGAARVQLGARALALAATLNKQLGLTVRKTCRVLKQLGGLSITPGGLTQALDRVADNVSSDYAQLMEQLRASPSVFADETSWWVNGPGWWLWVFTTTHGVTYYRVEPRRNAAVVRDTLGENFAGVLVSDCLSSYDPLECRKHKCVAHHQRAIKQARDRPDTLDHTYLAAWSTVFTEVLELCRQRTTWSAEEYAARVAALTARVNELLEQVCTQSGDVAVQNRLLKQRAHLLGCLTDPAVEPTNNRAERELRPAVIARKLSCGNKTESGRETWQTLASLAATCHGRGENFVDYLVAKLPLAKPAG